MSSAFHSDELQQRLQALTAGFAVSRWLVAFSGGIDSTVLLHALATGPTQRPRLAIHVDHALHPDSALWAAHCEATSLRLDVPYACRRVSVTGTAEYGPEAAARKARYAAFLSFMQSGDCLLSGHHEDDQAETLLLNLVRGSGPAGLAGIGARQSFGRGLLLRPLLGVASRDIEAYARRHELDWIDDPSNADTRFDRNFVRQEVLPKLASRWPAVANRLRRSAELVSEANELLNELADMDLACCGSPARLSLSTMAGLTQPRQRNLLRRAVRLCGLPPPPATRMYQAVHELIPAREDAQPLVSWPGAELRRYRDYLYVLPQRVAVGDAPGALLRPCGTVLRLGPGQGTLAIVDTGSRGIDPAIVGQGLRVRYREGGEALRISGEGATRKLKKLLQEARVLPWMRDRLPLLYAGNALVAVADLWISADHSAARGLAVEWRGKPALN